MLAEHRESNCQNVFTPPILRKMRYHCENCQRWFKSVERLNVHREKGCEDDDPPLAVIYGNKKKTNMLLEGNEEIIGN